MRLENERERTNVGPGYFKIQIGLNQVWDQSCDHNLLCPSTTTPHMHTLIILLRMPSSLITCHLEQEGIDDQGDRGKLEVKKAHARRTAQAAMQNKWDHVLDPSYI